MSLLYDNSDGLPWSPLLPANLQQILTLSSEKRALSWLSVLPIEEHGFALQKGAICDALLWLVTCGSSMFMAMALLLTMQ